MKIAIFWFRRDLRLEDNIGLQHALASGLPVLPIFIFDPAIIADLPKDDARVRFIHDNLKKINQRLREKGASIHILHAIPVDAFEELITNFDVAKVFTNHDYEPYGIARDQEVSSLLASRHIPFETFKDQVIFEKDEILKKDGTPYTVYTPYKRRWLEAFSDHQMPGPQPINLDGFVQSNHPIPSLEDIGFEKSAIEVRPYRLEQLASYANTRDIPSDDNTSYLSPHLRFGTVSIRQIVQHAAQISDVFLSELIWREFFMQILYHFPRVVNGNFKEKYDLVEWRNNEAEFDLWCQGKTGFPMVDAGMRQLNQTGYMHNRVRMVVAGFLCKNLLIDWRWGEAYFASQLLDYELSSNNGNWQWAAGTGCDAAPYFRIFNPILQIKRFDPQYKYIQKWVPEYDSLTYQQPIVDYKASRKRAIDTYARALNFHLS